MSGQTENLTSALASSTRKHGKALATSFFVTTKVSRLYGYEHQNFQEGIDDLQQVLNFFLRNEGSTTLSLVNEFLLVNDVTLKIDLGGYQSYRHVVDLFREREIGDVTFHDGIDREELIRLIRLLNQSVSEEEPWESFNRALNQAELSHCDFQRLTITSEAELSVDPDARQAAVQTYYHTLAATEEAHDAFRSDSRFNPKRLKRSAQTIVDLVMSEESTILALTNVREGAAPEVNHATNTTILAAALGAKIGLSKRLIGDLAFASLVHDIGKVELDDPSDPQKVHPTEGARKLLLSGRVSGSVIRSMNVAFLHHRTFEGGGYPDFQGQLEPSLLTRIVAVANTYDGFTAGPPYVDKPLLPAEALSRVTELSGTLLDPTLVRVFVNLMGLFPVGSLVRLDTGELASIVRPHPKPEFLHRPYARIFTTASGDSADEMVDLTEKSGSEFARTIVGAFHPEEIDLELGEYLSVI
ncbi:MAG: HD domain-containing phosphohydrolase [Planctomycetota bacterium]